MDSGARRVWPWRELTQRQAEQRRERASDRESELRESALHESEQRFRFLYDNNPSMYFTLDASGTILSVNRYGAEHLGYTTRELTGRHVGEITHPSDRDIVNRQLAECLEQAGQLCRMEFRKVRRDGSAMWVRELVHPVRTAAGELVLLVVCDDMTEAKNAREEVVRILESITDAFFALDSEWRFTYVNRTAEEAIHNLLKRDSAVIGQSFWDIAPHYRGTVVEDEYRRAVREQQPAHFEMFDMVLQTWFDVHTYPSGDGLSVYFQDVTKRKLAEQERERLHELERRARAEAERTAEEEQALREAVAAVGTKFTSGEVIRQIAMSAVDATSADGALVTRIHEERGEVEVAAFAGEVPPHGRSVAYEHSYTRRVIEAGEPQTIDRLADFEGSLWGDDLPARYRDWALLVVPLAGDAVPIGALFLLRGPSRTLSPAQTARAQTFGELATIAFRKLQQLEEAEARRDELERVTTSRANLMRGFSHDLKNPLGAADGNAALLEDGVLGELSDRQLDSIRRIRRSIHTSLQLIEHLVELARTEAGQVVVECVAADAAAAAREVAEDYRAQASAAHLLLDIRAPQALITETDPARVRQILANLLSNAVKYTTTGTITVTAEFRDTGLASRTGAWIAISVTDTGPGIPPEHQERIFEEFTRLDPDARPGAGIGLAISRRIARLLGGEITLDSEPGRGSTFTLWLPELRGS